MKRGFLNHAANRSKKTSTHESQEISISIVEKRKTLPIYSRREQFLKAIEAYNVLIINGGTNSGKATQIPQFLHESGYTKHGKIGSTNPSDFATFSFANRVSKEMGVELGQEVGYATQFEDCTCDKTVIEYMTDKKLLQEFICDRKLRNYSVLIVDEAHQRTVSTDLLLGLVKNLVGSRSDLKVIISGVFHDDVDELVYYYDVASVFQIHDNVSSVEIIHTKAFVPSYINDAISKVLEIHATEPPGDILVFLSGQEEIELAEVIVKYRVQGLGKLSAAKLIICPVLANMTSEIQTKIFEPTPAGARKVVLLADIVDSYLFDGIVYAIDTGYYKIKGFHPMTGIVSSFSSPISKSSAKERADQSGRRGPGKCFRLYTKSNFNNNMKDNTMPEIRMADLAHAALTLKCLGIHHLTCFDFMEWPPIEHLLEAVDLLYALDAVDDVGKITETGRKMAEIPLDPMLSKMIVASEKYKCSAEIITIAAMLSVGNSVFYSTIADQDHCNNARMKFYTGNVGDDIALLKIYNSWAAANFSVQWCHENYIQVDSMKRARSIRGRLEALLTRVKIELMSNSNDLGAIKKAIISGFFPYFAKLQKNGDYRTVINSQTAFLYRSPSLPQVLPKCIIYHEMVTEEGSALRHITEVEPEWLVEVAPHCYRFENFEVVGVKKLPRGEWNADFY
ncbi:RNA helicase [Ranunculus cassubicifolius]